MRGQGQAAGGRQVKVREDGRQVKVRGDGGQVKVRGDGRQVPSLHVA